jgi:hypothetical protein
MVRVSNHPGIYVVLAVTLPLLSLQASAQERKEVSYTVGPKAVISVTNNYGPITAKRSGNMQVVVTTISHSDVVSLANEQHDNRIEFRSDSSRPGNGLVEYIVSAPGDACLILRSSDGTLRAEGLGGDVILETVGAAVEVHDIHDAHVHVKTFNGPIRLTAIRNSHLDIHSVSGDISLLEVSGSSVDASSGRGRVSYEGDPGTTGDYSLRSHSGDLDVSIPASASVEIKTHSVQGDPNPDFPKGSDASSLARGNSLLKAGQSHVSRFVLRSFKGKIYLKRP